MYLPCFDINRVLQSYALLTCNRAEFNDKKKKNNPESTNFALVEGIRCIIENKMKKRESKWCTLKKKNTNVATTKTNKQKKLWTVASDVMRAFRTSRVFNFVLGLYTYNYYKDIVKVRQKVARVR